MLRSTSGRTIWHRVTSYGAGSRTARNASNDSVSATPRNSAPNSDHLAELRKRARHGKVTIVYAAHDTKHSNAAVLAPLLRRGFPRKR
jgi:uncharacterized protein DUF488